MQIHNRKNLKQFRKDLRNNLTPAEATLWKAIQRSQLEGRKFRRQHSVGNYILDFYCPKEKLAIEEKIGKRIERKYSGKDVGMLCSLAKRDIFS